MGPFFNYTPHLEGSALFLHLNTNKQSVVLDLKHDDDRRALLRSGASDTDLTDAIASVWRARADRYSEIRTERTAARERIEMSYIGG